MSFMRKLREFIGLPQAKTIVSIPPRADRDRHYWFNEAVRKSKGDDSLRCPWKGCDGYLLTGPSGGMSVNLKCDTCERKWNLTEALQIMERI